MQLMRLSRAGGRARAILTVHAILRMVDSVIYLGSLTLIDSMLASAWLFSDLAERIEPTEPKA